MWHRLFGNVRRCRSFPQYAGAARLLTASVSRPAAQYAAHFMMNYEISETIQDDEVQTES